MKIISFSLFGHEDRYWHSLPMCISSHMIAYPDYTLKIYLSEDAITHPGYSFLKQLSSTTNRLKLQIVNGPYKGTEPTTWRMKPMWEDGVEIFFCRDIDSAPTTEEKKATEVFTQSNYAIHGIRSYVLHNTDLMAGLCGFKVNILRKLLFCKSFQEYINFGLKHVSYCKNWDWGCDQHLLRRFLFAGVRGRYCTKMALDSMVGSANKVSWYRGNHLPQEVYDRIDVSKYNELFTITDPMFKFLAEPSHFSIEQNNKILNINNECNAIIKEAMKHSSYYQEFNK